MQCVILAGGLGTRLGPRTESIPKTLIEIAGRPFAHWQLSWLAREGVEQVVYCVGHLGEQVRSYVGDGRSWSLNVQFVKDPEHLVGTAGAIRLALDSGVLDQEFFVLYGDSYLAAPLVDVDAAFRSNGAPALLTVFRNHGQWDTSNVVFDGSLVTLYEKDAPDPPRGMHYIDYGLSAFQAEVIDRLVPRGKQADLAPVLHQLSLSGLLSGYEVKDRFYEIGSVAGIAELEAILRDRES